MGADKIFRRCTLNNILSVYLPMLDVTKAIHVKIKN